MGVTREQWDARAKELAEQAKRDQASQHSFNDALLRQAVVSSTLLTGHPAWDTYLQRLQVVMDNANAEVAGWQDKITGCYEDADLRVVQLNLHTLKDRVNILKYCMSLPKEIMAEGALDKRTE